MLPARPHFLAALLVALALCPCLHAADPAPDLTHGSAQVERMLADRPSMSQFAADNSTKKLTRDDSPWQWAAKAYGTRISGSRVEWDNRASTNSQEYQSEHVVPEKDAPGYIRIRETTAEGSQVRKASFDEMWACCIFELFNIQGAEGFQKNYQDAIQGRVSRKDWIRRNTELEYAALVQLKTFFEQVWVPWSRKSHHPYETLCWTRNTPATYPEWIALYQDTSLYQAWGEYYDRSIVPYLQNAGLASPAASPSPPVAPRPPRVIYASATGAALDSDVLTGGGHDDTAPLQAALDQALNGPLELVMDGAALVSGLNVHSHTTIRCLTSSCGFFLQKQSNRPILINPHRTADPAAIVDQDIRLLGGTYNGNGLPDEKGAVDGNQLKSTREYSFTVALGFYGIADFTAAGITILHPRNYALHLANWRHVVLENDRVDVGVSEGINYDGIHFNGPGQDASIRNLSVHAWDDALAFNADDQAVVNHPDGPHMSSPISYGVPWIVNGPISDVVVDGLFLDRSLFGLRILSTVSRVDRIAVRNIHGDTRGWAVTIDNYFGTFRTGPGNIGGVTIENVDVHPHDWPDAYKWSQDRVNKYINVGCAIESLTLKNIRHSHRSDDRPAINFATNARVQTLQIDGLIVQDSEAIADALPRIALIGDATVDRFSLSNVTWTRPANLPAAGILVETRGAGGIGELRLQATSATRTLHLVKQSTGSIGRIIASNIIDTDSSADGGTFHLEKANTPLTLSTWLGPTNRQVVGPGASTTLRRGDAFTP